MDWKGPTISKGRGRSKTVLNALKALAGKKKMPASEDNGED
jgi:hypothetical protein